MPTVARTAAETLAEGWQELSIQERVDRFNELPRGEADDFFLQLQVGDQADLILWLPEAERRLWIRLLAPDDVTDLLQNVEPEDRDGLFMLLDESTRHEVGALLAYHEDVAGGRMNSRFARLRPEMTVDEALAYLRQQAAQVETIYYAYALDREQQLEGVVSLRDLFTSDRTKTVQDVMRKQFVWVTEEMDQEAVARLLSQHHLLAVPVLDQNRRMKGIVTVNDMVAVVQEEASEDIQKMGGWKRWTDPIWRSACSIW